MKITVKREIEFGTQDLCDILVTAFEGGIQSWSPRWEVVREPAWADVQNAESQLEDFKYYRYMAPVFGGELQVYDDENKAHNLSLDHLENGLYQLLNDPEFAWVLNGGDDEIVSNIDANVASAIIEYSLFCAVVYC